MLGEVKLNWIPIMVCSGRPNQRKSPVVVGPCTGSVGAHGKFRYSTTTRSGTPAAEGSNRTCVYEALAPKKPRLTRASRAASTASRISFDQYSSWPTERNALWFSSSAPFSWVSMLVEYVVSYPDRSSLRSKLSSHFEKLPRPESSYERSKESFTAAVVPVL